MIGWVTDQLLEHVVGPVTVEAADETVDEEFRVVTDPENRPIDSEAQEVDVTPLTTVPIGGDLAGGLTLRHTIMIEVDVQHGDPAEARRIRDGILVNLALKSQSGGRAMMGTVDSDTGQYVTRLAWSIDYRPVTLADTPVESAVMTFLIDTELDR